MDDNPMFRYLMKYVGTYRVLAHYDEVKNDFPRDNLGNIDPSFDDLYIPCNRGGGEIRHTYRDGVLAFYCPKITTLRHIVSELSERKNPPWFEVYDGGEEGFIYFKDSDMTFFAKHLKAKTVGKNTKPFSKQNLSKSLQKYKIPDKDAEDFSKILSKVPANRKISFAKLIMKDFESKKFSNKLLHEKEESGLSTKEFIHYSGLWGDFIKYAKSRVKSDF